MPSREALCTLISAAQRVVASDPQKFAELAAALRAVNAPVTTGQRVHKIIGQLANERGATAEDRVVRLVQEHLDDPQAPGWLLGARLSSLAEDRKGVDVVVLTRYGDVGVQVKNTEHAAEVARLDYRRNYPNREPRVFVAAGPQHSPTAVRGRLLSAVGLVVGRRRATGAKPTPVDNTEPPR